jgi:hypothetical protein
VTPTTAHANGFVRSIVTWYAVAGNLLRTRNEERGGLRRTPPLESADQIGYTCYILQLAPAVWNSAAITPANEISLSFTVDLPSIHRGVV